ncbi:MAG: HAD family phosphatase [Nanoarchaeota archaeon]
MIKIIIFDWGEVLCFYRKTFFRTIATKYKINYALFRKVELENRLKHEAGEISTTQFVQNINRACHSPISVHNYYTLHSHFVHLNKGMIKIIQQLKKKGYKIFLLSNNSEPTYNYIKDQKDLHKLFDKILFSYQIGLKKPDPHFFQHVLKDENIRFSQCLFVDDRSDSVVAAKKLGMSALQYTNLKKFKHDLAKLIL